MCWSKMTSEMIIFNFSDILEIFLCMLKSLEHAERNKISVNV